MGGPQQKLDPLKVWLGFVPSGWSKSEVWRHVSGRLHFGGGPTYVFLMKGAGTQSFSHQDLPGGGFDAMQRAVLCGAYSGF